MGKQVAIYGAGKIGRGYIANLFLSSGYDLLFVTHTEASAELLNSQGYYTLHIAPADQAPFQKTVRNYKAVSKDDPALSSTLQEIGLIAVAVYPNSFPSVAETVSSVLQKKFLEQDLSPLNIIVLANTLSAQKALNEEIYKILPDECREFAGKVLAVAGTIPDCTVILPDSAALKEDSLALLADKEQPLLIESCLKGELPQMKGFKYQDSLEISAMYKLYTSNMAHAASAYLGYAKNYSTILEALNDPEIEQVVWGALEEINSAFEREFSFSRSELEENSKNILKKFKNPYIKDTPERVGADPIRKLGYSERLIGAALTARRNGVYPYYILKIAAHAFQFSNPNDPSANELRKFIMEHGLDQAIRTYTGLKEADIIYTIKRHYLKSDGKFISEDPERISLIKKAYESGFFSEKKYRGCAQGTLIALSEVTGIQNKDLFRAATGLSGGMALCGDGVCGGYSGGVLFMSYIKGRDLDRIPIDGDKQNQYLAYSCAQTLHDHYISCYGSPVCMRVHEEMFNGEHFILRTKPRRDEFEEAGAHTVVCTTVVALACSWVMEILLDNGLYSIK